MVHGKEKVIFEYSRPGRGAFGQWPASDGDSSDIPEAAAPSLPAAAARDQRAADGAPLHAPVAAELLDRHALLPAGVVHDEVQPAACNQYAMLPEFLGRHPLAPESQGQGFLACMYELQEMLKEVTGMRGVSLTPMAGAQGEFAGVAMIRAYHRARGDLARNEIIVPEAAHGTNPATATMCGCVVREIPTDADGDVDLEALKAAVGPNTAGIMLTNPSTLGVFERRSRRSRGSSTRPAACCTTTAPT
jgi:glycine dehydrogenase subunit 2